jgi:hypothetical protein
MVVIGGFARGPRTSAGPLPPRTRKPSRQHGSRTTASMLRAWRTCSVGTCCRRVWIPPVAVREARELLRHRVALVRVRTRINNHVCALLAWRNLHPTSATRWCTARDLRECQSLALARLPTMVK